MYFRFCHKKDWNTSHLILGIPHDFKKKSYVKLHTYNGIYKVPNVYKWVKNSLSTKTEEINSAKEFRRKWLTYENTMISSSEVRMIYFSDLNTSPLLFSALSVKFPGRVRFGTVNTATKTGKYIWNELKTDKNYKCYPYVIITPEGVYQYGNKYREYFNFNSMEWFLSSLHPSTNDIFIFTLIVSNLLCCFEPFLKPGSIFKRLASLLWGLAKYNMYLILSWTAIITISQLSILNMFTDLGLTCLRVLSSSTLGIYIRSDCSLYLEYHLFLYSSFVIYLIIIGLLSYKLKDHEVEDTNPNEWNFAQFQTLQYLFYPTASLAQLSHLRNRWLYDLEENNQMIENFHTSHVSNEYISQLPVWLYKVPPITSTFTLTPSDVKDDPDQLRSKTNNDQDLIKETKLLNKCEGCEVETIGSVASDFHIENSDLINQQNTNLVPFAANNHSNMLRQVDQYFDSDQTPFASFPQNNQTTNLRSKCTNSFEDNKHTTHSISKDANTSKTDIHTAATSVAPVGMREGTDCVICLDNYTEGVKLCGLPCGHTFHYTCIIAWLTRDNHICPVCKWPSDKPKVTTHLHLE